MADFRTLGQWDGLTKRFASEDGTHYRAWRQDMDPVMRYVEQRSALARESSPRKTKSGMSYVGSVPIAMIVDWCNKNNYTFDQWARNEDGAKDKWKKHFMSRDYSKLHNQHVTTKRESSVFVVPEYIRRKDANLRRSEGSDS